MADDDPTQSGDLPTPPPSNTGWSGLPDVDWYTPEQQQPQAQPGQWQHAPPYGRGGSGYAHPGTPYRTALYNKPKSNLVMAILVTLFCCLPFGIVSIVYAAQVDSKWRGGDWRGAENAARNAKTWAWVGIVGGLVFSVVYAMILVSSGTSTTGTRY